MKLKKRGFSGSLSPEIAPYEAPHRLISRKAAAEGFVLLKNDAQTLPVNTQSKIGLYGAGAVMTIKGGTGSGDVNERDSINIWHGLINTGYQITSTEWLNSYEEIYIQARLEWKEKILTSMPSYNNNFFSAYSAAQFQMPCGNPINVESAKNDGADLAIFVISRISGENADRHDIEGDYYITAEEKALLKQISSAYKKILLVINTGGLIDLAFTEEFDNISAILQFVQAGQEGGNAFADVISGKITPSGKLADSWALDYSDYPNASFFSHKSGNIFKEEYKEGIFVGYRYFDTFDVPVRYCFGYGLSYTQFDMHAGKLSITYNEKSIPEVSLEVKVTNTGSIYSGKEVVQIYVSCPQSGLMKEFRRLSCFAKTKELKPGESQEMTLSFKLDLLTSYDETNTAWILDEGLYGIWLGNSLDSSKLCGTIKLDERTVLTQCEHICSCQEKLEEIFPDLTRLKEKETAWISESALLPSVTLCSASIPTKTIDYQKSVSCSNSKVREIVNSLSLDQLIALATGDVTKGQSEIGAASRTVPGAAAETVTVAAMEPWNVASIVFADGPAGLRLKRTYHVEDGRIEDEDIFDVFESGFFSVPKEKKGLAYYQYCTAIPVGTLLAQTWNTELMKEVGEMIAHEMTLFDITLWLAPGMNIHRNPLCGRNFEYYSEDPLLSGIMASAITLGVQSVPGCGTTIKHYACNNQEDNRMGSDSIVSERALREIYLKGFEITVKNAQPMSIMTSYNLINGVHTANSYDLCTKAARMEWGFAGAIMTDWTTTTNSTAGICTASGCIRAGNDMIMPGAPSDHENIRKELIEGSLTMEELTGCITNTVNIILQSNQYEDAVNYSKQFKDLDTYIKVS